MIQAGSIRLRVTVTGMVQGVGFRPFVLRLADELGVTGWVSNSLQGVVLEVEGPAPQTDRFMQQLRTGAPPACHIEQIVTHPVAPEGEGVFMVRAGRAEGARCVSIPPDLAPCADCLRELADPGDRRYRYPFLSCTQCGPRFSIVTDLPYDRPNTTLAAFPLCPACAADYGDETNRRFHAEPMACGVCGPQVELWGADGQCLARGEDALGDMCRVLREGAIVAVKGLGGFQLWVDAGSDAAVERLRQRKHRPMKPFAVLFPSLEAVQAVCMLSPEEAVWLTSPAAPIVLLRRRRDVASLAPAVSPGNPFVGAMLAATPLHQLVMAEVQRPVVATSGNRSEEPMVLDEREALHRLKGIADVFLVHDRPIARPVDDSVIRLIDGHPRVLRRSRGFVPTAIRLPAAVRQPVLALGGHVKSTIAMAVGDRVVLSQHLGDLSTLEADQAFRQAVHDLQRMLQAKPKIIACDGHPDYRSTALARELAAALAVPLVPVQHHHAHVAACMAERGLDGTVLGVAWDGAGYGGDGRIWGGEFLVAGYAGFSRAAHLRPFRLPGGESAMREPSRSAAATLWELLGEGMLTVSSWPATPGLREQLAMVLRSEVASPWTTSMGRLFDAVASLLGLCQTASFEGQAAMTVEFAAEREGALAGSVDSAYPVEWSTDGPSASEREVDWRPMMCALLDDRQRGEPVERIAARFHRWMAGIIVMVAERTQVPRVVLTGGCFQNRLLSSLAQERLEQAGFTVYSHRLVPPNDGGLSVGQAVVAAHQSELPS
jgi:hydrogenase maturation protein HypF